MTNVISPAEVGKLIREARHDRGMSQSELAAAINSSQSAIHRIEAGNQNVSLEMINRIAGVLNVSIITPARFQTVHMEIEGPTTLSGSITTRSSKNAAVALLCASVMNRGTTVLRGIAHIEEVNRLIEVLHSMGVEVTWSEDGSDLTIRRPAELLLDDLDEQAARLTRSIIMFLGPLMHFHEEFRLPRPGGCKLGARTTEPHFAALRRFGLEVAVEGKYYHALKLRDNAKRRVIILPERGDTATENVIMAAAMSSGETVIRHASCNYMVQDLCVFLTMLGVEIDGIGSTTLTVRGKEDINADITYEISEDPIETMSLMTAAIVTDSKLTVKRSPMEFVELELTILEEMGQMFTVSEEYSSGNGFTRLADVTLYPSDLHARVDKIHPLPFPGLNIDNLPFFALIAAKANGRTLIHDWVYENRAMHLKGLEHLGVDISLLDMHRVEVHGPTTWRANELSTPPALRPAVCIMLGMLACNGTSVLRDTYVINRGYEDLGARLNTLGARIETFLG